MNENMRYLFQGQKAQNNFPKLSSYFRLYKGSGYNFFHSYNSPILLELKFPYLPSFLRVLEKLNEPKKKEIKN